ncbi:MAG: RNA polymerase sigma factor [Myxococcota bacterium]
MPAIQAGSDTERRAREASALVEAAKGGDGRAFDELVRRYRPRIFALALHLTGRPSDADDITQDAFVKAYFRLQEFQGRSEFFTWLYRIALHRALNVKRDQGRRRTVGLDDPRVMAAVAVDAEGDPRRALELQERYAHLLAAFDRLSPLLRTTVVLTTLQGLSYREAAVVLEASEGTIAWRVHEARRQLHQNIEKLQRQPTPVSLMQRARKLRDAHRHGNDEHLSLEQVLSSLGLAPA